ncbi:MAG: gamma-glutamyltransferase [Planctomycetota bacterium]
MMNAFCPAATATTRRGFLSLNACTAFAAAGPLLLTPARRSLGARAPKVLGQTTDPRVEFAAFPGGHAVDAAVATALLATVKAPGQTGVGGYGLSAMVSVDGGKQMVAIEANSAAPQAMAADIFQPDPDGTVKGRINDAGWLSAGVPGVMAGLQLLIDRFCSVGFAELVKPAISLARDGFPWPESLAKSIAGRPIFRSDPGSQKLYFRNGSPLPAGERFRNPDLAALLETLAAKNRVDDFYRGGIAAQIADGFARNGGLVSSADLANYSARTPEPLSLQLGDHSVHTPPLTAGGLSVLQMLHAEHALPMDLPRDSGEYLHAVVEIMRMAWRDRLTLLGDFTDAAAPVAVTELLSAEYAGRNAQVATAAAREKRILQHPLKANGQSGTIHISAADDQGRMIALTLTHGNTFGSGVTVEGLGLTLGHGMSRFDPRPGHPNGPGPGKRPLHNMVPAIVARGGESEFAIGGAGGRKIPNTVFSVLRAAVLSRMPLQNALTTMRMHTEGTSSLLLTPGTPLQTQESLRTPGYQVSIGAAAAISTAERL